MRYFDMPGIDIVGYQVTPGLDAGTNRWDPDSGPDWDQEFFQFDLPAMARGAALIKDSPEIGEIAAGIAAVVFRPGNQNLMVSRRKAKDGEWIIIHNRTLDAAAVGRWTVHGRRGEIARFDAEQGRYFTVPFAADQEASRRRSTYRPERCGVCDWERGFPKRRLPSLFNIVKISRPISHGETESGLLGPVSLRKATR